MIRADRASDLAPWKPNDLAADPRIPGAVSVAAQSGKLPAAVLCLIGQQLANGVAREVAAQPDSLHLILDTTYRHCAANIVGPQACRQGVRASRSGSGRSRPVKEAVQNAGAELQGVGGYSLIDAVEHAHEVQVGRQA